MTSPLFLTQIVLTRERLKSAAARGDHCRDGIACQRRGRDFRSEVSTVFNRHLASFLKLGVVQTSDPRRGSDDDELTWVRFAEVLGDVSIEI